MLPFRTLIVAFALLSGVLTSFSVFAYEAVFDRLDGTGPSKKRVDVIEWDGNLEIHVYPTGSLKGLGAKLDERDNSKKVMVISYQFNNGSEPIFRRAILGVPFNAKIKGFKDPTEKDFDKLALSNQDLPKPWVPYQLQPAPKQWGPDGSKYDEDSTPQQLSEMRKNDGMDRARFNKTEGQGGRRPASVGDSAPTGEKKRYVPPHERVNKPVSAPAKPAEHNDGGVQEYQW